MCACVTFGDVAYGLSLSRPLWNVGHGRVRGEIFTYILTRLTQLLSIMLFPVFGQVYPVLRTGPENLYTPYTSRPRTKREGQVLRNNVDDRLQFLKFLVKNCPLFVFPGTICAHSSDVQCISRHASWYRPVRGGQIRQMVIWLAAQ